jgi:hypothetical protein
VLARALPDLPAQAAAITKPNEVLLGVDVPASSALTREQLGWEPKYPGLIADLDEGHYFRTPSA